MKNLNWTRPKTQAQIELHELRNSVLEALNKADEDGGLPSTVVYARFPSVLNNGLNSRLDRALRRLRELGYIEATSFVHFAPWPRNRGWRLTETGRFEMTKPENERFL